jgi:hypothetical protein
MYERFEKRAAKKGLALDSDAYEEYIQEKLRKMFAEVSASDSISSAVNQHIVANGNTGNKQSIRSNRR